MKLHFEYKELCFKQSIIINSLETTLSNSPNFYINAEINNTSTFCVIIADGEWYDIIAENIPSIETAKSIANDKNKEYIKDFLKENGIVVEESD